MSSQTIHFKDKLLHFAANNEAMCCYFCNASEFASDMLLGEGSDIGIHIVGIKNLAIEETIGTQ